MPSILDLFDLDYQPNRPFERVIQPDDPKTLYRDLRDYVLPPEVKAWLFDTPSGFVHQYLASANSVPDAVCTWITGFFGSGKSHLLKVQAHLLGNTDVADESGRPIKATKFLCDRFTVPHMATLITGQLSARPVVVQMLEYARGGNRQTKEASISYIILSRLERSLGYSSVPWIAQLERLLRKNNRLDDFRQLVTSTTAADGYRQEWEGIKNDDYLAQPLLIQGLHKLLPRTYKTEAAATDAVRLAEKNLPTQEAVVRRLAEEAKAVDPHKGRLILCLDEVRLYLGNSMERITELQILAQQVKSVGQGKVFLIVTGQEAPEDVDSRFHDPASGIGVLADRFPEKFRLSETNIDYVACERLLRKSNTPARIQPLRDLIATNRPQLSTAVRLPNVLQNPNGRFTNTEPADLERYYPLLPYHVVLLQQILNKLRSSGPSGGVAGDRERAILIVIRALFGEPANPTLAAAALGTLATFDRVYDVLEEELKAIHLNQRDQIVKIQQSGDPEAPFLASVAKAVLLLQQAAQRFGRVTEEFVAAVLYPRLGADPNAHAARVKEALKKLTEAPHQYATLDPELGYRFLTETETRFEKIVAEQDVTDADRFGVLLESAEKALKKKFFKHDYAGTLGKRKFTVKVTLVDAPGKASLAAGDHLDLQILTPAAVEADPHWADTALMNSTSAPERLTWSIKDPGKLIETVERIVRVRKALKDARLNTTDGKEQEQIETQRQTVEHLAHDDQRGCLPTQILQGLGQGTLVWNGNKQDLHGLLGAEEVFAETANKAIKAVYTEFDAGSAVVVDADLAEILKWKTSRPKCVEKLQLMDASGKVLLDRPVLKAVVDRLRRPDHKPEEMRKGEALANEFDGKPFGWEDHVVRAALAALLRAGAVTAREGQIEIRTPTEVRAVEVFSGWNRFKHAVFEYVGELTPAQRQLATEALQTLFERAGEDTFEKIDRALGEVLATWLPEVVELVGVSQATHLPCHDILAKLQQDLKTVQMAQAGTPRIQAFLQDQRQVRLASGVPVYKAVREFRINGLMEEYQKTRNFVSYPGAPFVQRAGGDLLTQLESLRGNLAHAEFYSGTRWAAITEAHHAIRQAYVADYRQAHTQRQQAINAAVGRVQGHRNWSRLDAPAQELLLDSIRRNLCDANPGGLDENTGFVCLTCKTDANSLAAQVATLPVLENQALAQLEALDRPPTPPPTTGPGVKTVVVAEGQAIAGPDQIAALADSLRTALTQALPEGKVTVDIRVHTAAKE